MCTDELLVEYERKKKAVQSPKRKAASQVACLCVWVSVMAHTTALQDDSAEPKKPPAPPQPAGALLDLCLMGLELIQVCCS